MGSAEYDDGDNKYIKNLSKYNNRGRRFLSHRMPVFLNILDSIQENNNSKPINIK